MILIQEVIMSIKVYQGDITTLAVDAIVNAANRTLLGGGGVDGAIHRAAGRELLAECRTLNGCETGEAKITGGYKLPAKHVIHTVGPVWHGGKNNEDQLLENAYANSLRVAAENGLKSIAFPAISTGVYGFPKDRAAHIAVDTIKRFLETHDMEVILVAFSASDAQRYEELLA
jgi:O-acetyl-ADP-ribose deacetylase (regulator of RNase III)